MKNSKLLGYYARCVCWLYDRLPVPYKHHMKRYVTDVPVPLQRLVSSCTRDIDEMGSTKGIINWDKNIRDQLGYELGHHLAEHGQVIECQTAPHTVRYTLEVWVCQSRKDEQSAETRSHDYIPKLVNRPCPEVHLPRKTNQS